MCVSILFIYLYVYKLIHLFCFTTSDIVHPILNTFDSCKLLYKVDIDIHSIYSLSYISFLQCVSGLCRECVCVCEIVRLFVRRERQTALWVGFKAELTISPEQLCMCEVCSCKRKSRLRQQDDLWQRLGIWNTTHTLKHATFAHKTITNNNINHIRHVPKQL